MAKNKNKIILAVIVLAILAGAWLCGCDYAAAPQAPPQLTINNEQLTIQETPFEADISDPVYDTSMETNSGGINDGSFTVTLTVRCDTLLDNMNLLDKEKHELVPADGLIFPAALVEAYEGESVFNVLQREMRRVGIHMEFRSTPIYNSSYIIAVNNLYEFDAGELSGWLYKVNGLFPNYGASRYQLSPGDEIELLYSCDLGRDVGEYLPEGTQRNE